MPSLSVVLRPRLRADGTQTIAFRLTIDRVAKFEATSHHVRADQFAQGFTEWVYDHPDARRINRNLEKRRQQLADNLLDAGAGLIPLNHEAIFSGSASAGTTVGDLLLAKANKHATDRAKPAYRKAILFRNELIACWGADLPLAQITKQRVEQYVTWLRTEHSPGPGRHPVAGNGNNTIKKKLSRLAGLVDTQKDQGLYSGVNAFKLVHVSSTGIKKGKLTWDDIAALEALRPEGMTEITRDMFLFSFYAHGMRFADCLTFRRTEAEAAVKRAGIDYKMAKNSAHINVAHTPPLERIMLKYLAAHGPGSGSGVGLYLFPLLKREYKDKWDLEDDKGSWNAEVNTYLKRVAILAGVDKHISFHIARHTFADLMKKHQAAKGQSNIYTIQQALGHKDIKTTQMYLASLEDEAVNKEVAEMFAKR